MIKHIYVGADLEKDLYDNYKNKYNNGEDFYGVFGDVQDIFIDVSIDKMIGMGDIDFNNTYIYVHKIESCEEYGYKNAGKKMINYLKSFNKEIRGEATVDSVGFWKKVDAVIGDYVSASDCFEFIIPVIKNNL